MSYASKQLARPVIAVVLALGLALTAVGSTMPHGEHDSTTHHDFEFTTVYHDGRSTTDLRGKILRISVNEDESYAVDAEGQRLRYEWDFDADGDVE